MEKRIYWITLLGPQPPCTVSAATADTHHCTSPCSLPRNCLWRLQVNGRFGIQASVRMTPSQAASRAVQDNCCYITRSTPVRG
jgi:hypothetical protein